MLCHGLGLLGRRSIAVLTDTAREPPARGIRRYTPLDGRSPERLSEIVAKLESRPKWLGVIDGGGNRPALDRKFYEMSGLVPLPFRESHQDIRTVRNDPDEFPRAYGIPSQWPTNPWQQMAAEHTLDVMMQDYRPRLLDPVYTVSASKPLLEYEMPRELPTVLNNICRTLAWQVLERLNLPEEE